DYFVKKATTILLSLFCICSELLFCGTTSKFSTVTKQLELIDLELFSLRKESDKEKAEMKNTVIKENINYVEGYILKKRRKAEAKLEKYQISLQNSENGKEVRKWLKKAES